MNKIDLIQKDISKVEHYKTVIVWLSVLVMLWSWWLTTKGLLDKNTEAGVLSYETIPSVFGTGLLVAAVLCGLVYLMLESHEIIGGWWMTVLVIFLAPAIFLLSTSPNLVFLAGPSSLVYEMREKADMYDAIYNKVDYDRSHIIKAEQFLGNIRNSTCDDHQGELNSGVLTGSAGNGPVTRAYGNACRGFGTIISSLRNFDSDIDRNSESINKVIAEMKDITMEQNISVFERQKQFRIKTGELERLVRKSSNESGNQIALDSIVAQLNSVRISVNAEIGGTSSYSKIQQNAIDKLGRNIELFGAELRKLLSSEPDVDFASFDDVEDLSYMLSVIFKYWKLNIVQILQASIDFVPIIFGGPLAALCGRRLRKLRANLEAEITTDDNMPEISAKSEPVSENKSMPDTVPESETNETPDDVEASSETPTPEKESNNGNG